VFIFKGQTCKGPSMSKSGRSFLAIAVASITFWMRGPGTKYIKQISYYLPQAIARLQDFKTEIVLSSN
jgi:hypothetical protein